MQCWDHVHKITVQGGESGYRGEGVGGKALVLTPVLIFKLGGGGGGLLSARNGTDTFKI